MASKLAAGESFRHACVKHDLLRSFGSSLTKSRNFKQKRLDLVRCWIEICAFQLLAGAAENVAMSNGELQVPTGAVESIAYLEVAQLFSYGSCPTAA